MRARPREGMSPRDSFARRPFERPRILPADLCLWRARREAGTGLNVPAIANGREGSVGAH